MSYICDLKNRLLEVYKKFGMGYKKMDFIDAGFSVKPFYFEDVETGFEIPLKNYNAINYVLKGFSDIFQADNQEEDIRQYLEDCKSVSVLLANLWEGKPNEYKSLIEGEFLVERFKEFSLEELNSREEYSLLEKELTWPPQLMQILWENSYYKPQELSIGQIIRKFRIIEVVNELEEMCKKIG